MRIHRSRIVVGCITILMLAGLLLNEAPAHAYIVGQRSGFPVEFTSGPRVQFGSPTLADIDNDGTLEIIVGSLGGMVYATDADGNKLWEFNLTAALDAASTTKSQVATKIRAAPAVADINGDGVPEIIVAGGDVLSEQAHGGVTVLNNQGQQLPGWPRLPRDFSDRDKHPGYADGVVSSPAVGDIDGDGQPEIVFGAFDQHVYAYNADGSLVPGWGGSSVNTFVLDTVWSSPALVDLNNDGDLEVIIGVDAHLYRGIERFTEDGGDLYAFDGDATILWRSHQDEIFESSPVVADLDNDGKPEIVTGTGTFYSDRRDPDGSRGIGRYVSAWNHDGSLAWRTPMPQRITGSAAIADLDGNGSLEVVIATRSPDSKVYVLNGATGAILRSAQPRDIFDTPAGLGTPVLGDFDGDGLDDVFINVGWDVVVLRGTDLFQFTSTSTAFDDPKPAFYAQYLLNNTPAVGDLDGNGKLELVAAGGSANTGTFTRINVWDLPDSSDKTSWPMFRGRANHHGRYVPRLLRSSLNGVSTFLTPAGQRSFTTMIDTSDGSSANWTVVKDDPDNIVSLNRTSGGAGDNLEVTVRADAGSTTASLTVQATGLPPVTIPVNVFVTDTIYEIFLPSTIR